MNSGQFQRGQPRPHGAGRKPGVPNKRTQDLIEKVEASGLNPFDVLIELLTASDPQMKFAAAKELCQYLYPKRKAVEYSGDQEDREITVSIFDYTSPKT